MSTCMLLIFKNKKSLLFSAEGQTLIPICITLCKTGAWLDANQQCHSFSRRVTQCGQEFTSGSSAEHGTLRCAPLQSLADVGPLTVGSCACKIREPSNDMYRNLQGKCEALLADRHNYDSVTIRPVQSPVKEASGSARCSTTTLRHVAPKQTCMDNADRARVARATTYQCMYGPQKIPCPHRCSRSWACEVPFEIQEALKLQLTHVGEPLLSSLLPSLLQHSPQPWAARRKE